ncbi:MAG: hypothetical protein VCD66_03925 [Alphaproteobacteria bacterium]
MTIVAVFSRLFAYLVIAGLDPAIQGNKLQCLRPWAASAFGGLCFAAPGEDAVPGRIFQRGQAALKHGFIRRVPITRLLVALQHNRCLDAGPTGMVGG